MECSPVVVMESSRMPSKPRPDNMFSSPWAHPMPRLRKGGFARNEQSENRETNYAAHASSPAVTEYGPAVLEATLDGSSRLGNAATERRGYSADF